MSACRGGRWDQPPALRRLAVGLASDDLRDALVAHAHAHDLGYGLHGQTLAVGGADGLILLLPEIFAGLLQGGFAPQVVLGEGGQTGSGLGRLAFRSGVLKIV